MKTTTTTEPHAAGEAAAYLIKAMSAVMTERQRQDQKWGANRDLDDGTWLKILVEEVGEVAKAMLEKDLTNLREELVQVAAVAVAAIENIDRTANEKLRKKEGV